MDEVRKMNAGMRRLLRSGAGLEAGVAIIKEELNTKFRFTDTARFSRTAILECYGQFEAWLTGLLINYPLPEGILALYFGLFEAPSGIELYLSGSKRWDASGSDWFCYPNYYPEGEHLQLPIFEDIRHLISDYNLTGQFLMIGIVSQMVREFTDKAMLSLLDSRRRLLHIACGYDEGAIYNIGALVESGLMPPEEAGRAIFR